jgi:ribosome-associated translation inhibitor RaiA
MPRGSGIGERKGSGRQQEVPEADTEAPKSIAEADTEAPYSIKFFVDGDKDWRHAEGVQRQLLPDKPDKYMEDKVEDALAYAEGKIDAVDVRLKIEGHAPRTYRFEVTVKGSRFETGTVVVSKSKHAHATFQEAVNDMHDSLKRNMLKEKEKRLGTVRHADKLSNSGIVASMASEDEQSEDENDPGKEEEEFFTKDPSR